MMDEENDGGQEPLLASVGTAGSLSHGYSGQRAWAGLEPPVGWTPAMQGGEPSSGSSRSSLGWGDNHRSFLCKQGGRKPRAVFHLGLRQA